MKEEWKTIPNVHEWYMVSNFGRVKSLYDNKHKIKRERILKPYLSPTGYFQICLAGKRYLIHRLVALAFIPNPCNYPCINHKDENKQNNYVKNLEWCTQKYNTRYSCKGERLKYLQKHCQKLGRKYGGFYLSKYAKTHFSIPVIGIVEGEVVYRFYSSHEAERITGIDETTIRYCCDEKRQYKSAGKYKGKRIQWRNANEKGN